MERKRKAYVSSDSSVAKSLHIRQKTTDTEDIDKCVASCVVKLNADMPPCAQQEICKFFRAIRHSSVDSDQKVPDDSSQSDQSDVDQSSQELSSSGESDSSQGKINTDLQHCFLSYADSSAGIPSSPTGAGEFNLLEDQWFQNQSDFSTDDSQPKQPQQCLPKNRNTSSKMPLKMDYDKAESNDQIGEKHFKQGLSDYRAEKYKDAKTQWKLAEVYKNAKAYYGFGVLYTVGNGVKKINYEKVCVHFEVS